MKFIPNPITFKLQTSNLRLPIETGRWYNIPREDRKCNGIGDEFHILFLCENEIVVILRNKYIPNIDSYKLRVDLQV
jgi:hypothetical protein